MIERADGRAKKVAGYVAKYATKSSEGSGVLDQPIRSAEDLDRRALDSHTRRMVETAWRLGADPAFADLGLARHAHALGYGGHFLTKSRRYSTTFGALRGARAEWRARRRNGVVPGDPSVVSHWELVGIGWANQGEAWFRRLAAAAAGRGAKGLQRGPLRGTP